MPQFEQTALTVVGPPVVKEDGMQESDLLDLLPDGEKRDSSGTDHIKLVSLGCYCGPKLSFKHIGRGSETLPFDWMRTRQSGLLKFMRHDFEGFYDFVSKKPVPGCSMTTYRGYYHSFWHDDPSDPGMRTRYDRRIARFKGFEQSETPILFVRTIPTTDELKEVPELVEEITSRYGKLACLLLIIDFQATAPGPALVEGYPNLLVYYLTGVHHVAEDGKTPTPPYCKPVLCALDWMVGRPIEAMKFPNMEKIHACADETHWGLDGLGGLKAFESRLEGPEDEPLEVLAPGLAAAAPAPLPSQDLEQCESAAAAAEDPLTVVSLGCSPATKMTLQAMGRGCQALPFDWLRISHQGLLHFLHRGFEAPIREGLGAGTQRPTETLGFLDVVTRKPVPGTGLVMCRSHLHSFWHDDVGQPEVRERLQGRIRAWNALGSRGEPLLFVRAVASTAELARADELLRALSRRFGPTAALLLIVDFQQGNLGPHVVEGFEEDLLVYFVGAECHQGEQAKAPYRAAVECALAWLQGEPLEMSSVADLAALQGIAAPTSWGLVGPGGLHAFEGLGTVTACEDGEPGDGEPSAAAVAETAWLEEAKREAAKDNFALVSLGSCPVVFEALDLLGLGSVESPFDSVRCRMEGLLRLLREDFRDFFEVGDPEPVEGSTGGWVLRKAAAHSFCDAFDEATWTEAYRRVLEQFRQLAKSSRPKLFVRALASLEELSLVLELREELARSFGSGIFLVVIVSGQAGTRTLSVEGAPDVLVFFTAEVIGTAADPKPLSQIIKRGLDAAVGKPTKAGVAPDLATLRELARPFAVDLRICGAAPFAAPAPAASSGTGSTASSVASPGQEGKAGAKAAAAASAAAAVE